MKKSFTLLFALLLAGIGFSQTTITVSGHITSNTTWTASNIYLLDGYVHVDSGFTLTIEPGTIVKGKADTGGGTTLSTLLIDRGAKINAVGTVSQPIVFTSEKAPGARTYGDWGGIVLCGRATINVPGGQAEVEGTPAGTALYGGPDDTDSSGVMKYVRIEFGGIPLQPNKEINGITFAGIGSKTVIDYIQVSVVGDDAFEWFGGTVNCKHLISYKNWDDDFDTDFGYRGKVQWAVALRDSNVADPGSGSNGFESDNDASGSTNTPFTAPIFSNVTHIGPLATASTVGNSNFKRSMHLRRNTHLSVHNSIFMGMPIAFLLDGSAAEANATNNDLQVRNHVFAGCQDSFKVASGSVFDLSAWYRTGSFANEYHAAVSDPMLTDPFNYTAPNFMPTGSSPMISGADFTNGNLNGDAWFATTTYRGAFGTTDWTSGWANWTPETTVYELVGIEEGKDISVLTAYPNPTRGIGKLEFHLTNSGNTRISLLDLSGKEISILHNGDLNAGLNAFTYDLTNQPSGFYFLNIQTETGKKALKICKF